MKENGDVVVETAENKPTSAFKVVLVSILFATVAVVVDHLIVSPVFLRSVNQRDTTEASVQYAQTGRVDEEVVSLFVTYDEDLDGALDLSEFVKVANRILNRKLEDDHHHLLKSSESGFVQDWQDMGGEKLTIMSYFTPLVVSTMSKYSDQPYDTGNENQLQGLASWTSAAASIATFSVKKFEAFLPGVNLKPTALGQPWYIVESRFGKGGPGLTNERYYPPIVKGRLAIIYRLLTMFHPRPFLLTRFGPQGTVACVRAENKDYWDIVFRIHAEYQLNEPPLLPFWFTPGQFLGNIVIKKDGSHVHSFHLAVPNNRSLNVDMEWLVPVEPPDPDREKDTENDKEDSEGGGNMEVDIGFLPQMELQNKMPSALFSNEQTDGDLNSTRSGDDLNWDQEISFEEAYKAIEGKFYGFKKVAYLPFQDAINQAKAKNKLVHHILLWGALDDQSC